MISLVVYICGVLLTAYLYEPEEKGEYAWVVPLFWPVSLPVLLFVIVINNYMKRKK